eukprot:TRINITY_DN12953_c0_g1_i1.p1 TRINITY_DN12953_c0_g1~~TRINITY_DN12953_c0_g1_i1.p1  ORF type:complete len:362 (+),score=93.28 TRINITY_DN12953_c0_g1_i1:81-1088(+)
MTDTTENTTQVTPQAGENVNNHPDETMEQKKIRKQLQFYFSNSNYPRDNFLLETAEQNNGWIPVDVFLKFNKIKALTEELDAVVKACRESRYIEVNEDGTLVKRIAPLPEVDDFEERSIHLGGLNFRPHPSIGFIKSIFKDSGAKVMSIWNCRSKTRGKKELYVELESVEQANALIEKGEHTYVDIHTGESVTLPVMSKKAHKELPELKAKRGADQIEQEITLKTCVKVPGLGALHKDDERFVDFVNAVKEDIANAEIGNVKFVDVKPEDYTIVRFNEVGPAEILAQKLQAGLEIRGQKFESAVLMDEDEERAYKLAILHSANNRSKKKKIRSRD